MDLLELLAGTLGFFGSIVGVVLYIGAGIVGCRMAARKGHGCFLQLLCFTLSIVGLIIACILPDESAKLAAAKQAREDAAHPAKASDIYAAKHPPRKRIVVKGTQADREAKAGNGIQPMKALTPCPSCGTPLEGVRQGANVCPACRTSFSA